MTKPSKNSAPKNSEHCEDRPAEGRSGLNEKPDDNVQDVLMTEASTSATVPPDPGVGIPSPALDPFDPSSLRLTQNFAASIGVQRLLTTVPVRKPSKEWFVRAHPREDYRLQTAVLELKED